MSRFSMVPAPRILVALVAAIAANLIAAAAVLDAGLAAPEPERPTAIVPALNSEAALVTLAATTHDTVAVPAPPHAAARTATPPAQQRAARPGGRQVVQSTAYCLSGTTASGDPVGPGGVAMNGISLGERFQVLDGPLAGAVLVVNDRIGHGTQFDVWMASCDAAREYGRRTITIAPVPG